jgi:aldehyde dehydrogenase (NAD+)
VGQHIGEIAARGVKEVSLELGGNNAQIVLDDADIEKAADAAIFGSFFHAGQICMRINRLVIDESVYEEFKDIFVKKVSELAVGDPEDENNYYGPIINDEQRDKVNKLIQDTIEAGASVELEGKTEGNVISPWILGDVTNDMPAAENEVFGPAVVLIRAKSTEEAIEIANDTTQGLSGSVFTEDLYKGIQIANQIESGMIHVNDQPINDEPHVMFGGEKQSGIGRFNGEWVADTFTRERWISVQETARF